MFCRRMTRTEKLDDNIKYAMYPDKRKTFTFTYTYTETHTKNSKN